MNKGEKGSLASTLWKGSDKFARKPDYMIIVELEKDVKLEIVYLKTDKPNSSQDKHWQNYKKLIWFCKNSIDTTRILLKLKRIFNQSSKR